MSAQNFRVEAALTELVAEDDLVKARSLTDTNATRLGPLLVRMGALSEEKYLEVFSDVAGMLVVPRDRALPDEQDVYRFAKAGPINFDWLLEHEVVLWESDQAVFAIAKDPANPLIQQTLQYFFDDTKLTWCLSANHHLDRFLSFMSQERAVEDLFAGGDLRLQELAEEAPVVELVNNVIAQATDARASDIHIEPGDGQFAVRLRVDGVLRLLLNQPIARFPAVASRIKLLAGLDIAERRLPQDGRFTQGAGSREMDIRVSTVPDTRGESIVLRLLPKHRDDLQLKGLGLEDDHLKTMIRWAGESSGMVLVTGPTGSGKSTTLYSTLKEVDNSSRKVITVEDPVESNIAAITQIQTHAEIGYTFAVALRAILRQDPDVIMVGEIRDLETAEIAIRAALSGHLVLSTIHTNDAISTFTRLVDMGIEPYLVAAPLKGVQAQRLVRRLCPHCSTPTSPPQGALPEVAEANWRASVGCTRCQGTGYNGRVGIYEMLDVDVEIQRLITANAAPDEIREVARRRGFRTLLEDGLKKAARGETTAEEVFRVVNELSV